MQQLLTNNLCKDLPCSKLIWSYSMALDILNDRELLINRELGLIQFYRRVLAQVLDEKVPLLERLGYLCIVAKNCDELFEVRVARLLKWEKAQPNKILADGLKVCDALIRIRADVCKLFKDMYEVYHQILVPALGKQDILILDSRGWTKDQQKWAYNYFIAELKPVLTPIGIDPSHPFPRVPNKSLHFAVELEGKDQFGRESKIAIVEAPRILQRVIRLPEELAPTPNSFVLLQDIIRLHVDEFFYGMKVRGCYPFRVTRAADLTVKSDLKNLRNALTAELHNRKYAECSRIELDISRGEPNSKFMDSLLKQFNLELPDLYYVDGPVNLARLADIMKMVDNDDLKFTRFNPGMPKELQLEPDIFKAMAKGDILLHTPFQSFDPVVELTRQAAEDPNVLAVKMTVYRTGNDSELVQNLIRAARAGKQVVASIELFARFDEEANVELAKQLEEAGAHVVYGVMGYKVHAKMLKIVRKEDNHLQHYVHLGTGNYHQTTAKIYTDFGNSYRVNGIDNLFCDSILSRYNEFDQNFPLSATQDPVSEDQLIIAKKACEKKEITLEPFLQDCIHDFTAVKNDSFSESASLGQKIKTNPEIIFRGNDLRDGFNGYYELEFKFIKKNNETIINDLNISTRTDDSAIEYRVDGVAKYRVVTDYFNNKIININLQKETKTGFRINSERILNWEIGLPAVWTKTDKKKIINGLESTLYYFSIPNSKGFAWITNSIKHNHIFPFKYLLGLFRDEKFPTLLFPNNLFGYNEFGMILEAQIDDDNGSRIFTIKNIKKAPDLKMLDLSDVLIKD